jgi:hypothetical protein
VGELWGPFDLLDLGGLARMHRVVQIEHVLQIQPEVGRRVERLGETQGRVGRNAALTVNDLIEAGVRHADAPGERSLCDPERAKELFNEHFARRDRPTVSRNEQSHDFVPRSSCSVVR